MRVFFAAAAAASLPLAATAGPLPQNSQPYPQVQVSGFNGNAGPDSRQIEGLTGGGIGSGYSGIPNGSQFHGAPPVWGSLVHPGPGPVMGTVIQPRHPYVGTAIVPAPGVFVIGTGIVQPGTIPLWNGGPFAPAPLPIPVPFWEPVALPGGGGAVMGTVVNPGGQYLGTAVSPAPQFNGTGINPNAQYQGLGVSTSPQFGQAAR